jgi:hypothetical protein
MQLMGTYGSTLKEITTYRKIWENHVNRLVEDSTDKNSTEL